MQTAWQVLKAYFLGLLAKIKCSICSYDCEKSYGRHCLPDFHNNISSQGLCVRNLLQPFPTVFLALHSSLVTLTLYWVPITNNENHATNKLDNKWVVLSSHPQIPQADFLHIHHLPWFLGILKWVQSRINLSPFTKDFRGHTLLWLYSNISLSSSRNY